MRPSALQALFAAWEEASPQAGRCIDAVRNAPHGDWPRWRQALDQLPFAVPATRSLGAAVSAGEPDDLAAADRLRLEAALRDLLPWRKGPFNLFGVHVDAEWRSDRKWARVAPHVDLRGRRVLDAGCGNGYYGWRMLEAGAASVTGVDPSLLFALQHAAAAYYLGHANHLALPLRLEDLELGEPFDVVFSMGVLYHRRDPLGHLRDLARHAHAGTVLVIESLIAPDAPLAPAGRYARMRNVRLIPDVATLFDWLQAAGFGDAQLVDAKTTTAAEQRATAWMPYQSLADALDAEDPSRTVEGHPAPRRAIVVARR